jgi:anti-anti-sigma factor
LSTYRHRGEARLDVACELDIASAPTLAATIARISRKPHQTVLVDLGALSFCDCAGLGVLLDQHLDIRGPHPAGPRSSGPRKRPNDRTRLSQGRFS